MVPHFPSASRRNRRRVFLSGSESDEHQLSTLEKERSVKATEDGSAAAKCVGDELPDETATNCQEFAYRIFRSTKTVHYARDGNTIKEMDCLQIDSIDAVQNVFSSDSLSYPNRHRADELDPCVLTQPDWDEEGGSHNQDVAICAGFEVDIQVLVAEQQGELS